MSGAAVTFRRVEVRPPSSRVELGNVVRFSMVIVIGAWMFLATDSATFRDGASATKHLLPFQTLIQNRPPIDQRMFRELQEGLLEAESRRRVERHVARVAALPRTASPFALGSDRQGRTCQWRLTVNGAFVNYLGLPQQSGSPAWLLLVQEPEPGAPPDPAREDEEHHRLLGGDMLHVSTWVRADARVPAGTTRAPQAEGWTQLYAVGPQPAGR